MKKQKDHTLLILFLVEILADILHGPGCYKGGQKEAANSLQSYELQKELSKIMIKNGGDIYDCCTKTDLVTT